MDDTIRPILIQATSFPVSGSLRSLENLIEVVKTSNAKYLVLDIYAWSCILTELSVCDEFTPHSAISAVQEGRLGTIQDVEVVTDAFIDPTDRILPRGHLTFITAMGEGFSLRLDLDNNTPKRPTIVCLCGSSRFYTTFQSQFYEEEMKGKIVLTMGFLPDVPDDAHHGMLGITEEQKLMLDKLHHDKIRMADEVLVLNVDGYIGQSTRREIELAHSLGKIVRYLETPLETSTNV